MPNRFRLSNKFFIPTIISLFFFGEFSLGQDNSSLAVLIKTINEVKKRSSAQDWVSVSKGEGLISGDKLRTEEKSLAIVKFLDNSMIRLHERSELVLSGEGPHDSRIKSVYLNNGSLGFEVKKQKQNEQFRLTSPTSVASIRGTLGKWSGGKGRDTLIVTDGLVNLKNIISSKDVDVPAGFIGFSDQDGSISSRKATEDELSDASNAVLGGSSKELKFELQDSKGNKKELKLKYKK